MSANITGERSTYNTETEDVLLVIDFPGYMYLTSIGFIGMNSTTSLDSWSTYYNEDCTGLNSAELNLTYIDLLSVADVYSVDNYVFFSMDLILEYYSLADITDKFDVVTVEKMITFSINAPSSILLNVTVYATEGGHLLYDVLSHGIVETDGNQTVFIGFSTFVTGEYEFSGAFSISSTYFSNDNAQLELLNTTDFIYSDTYAGKVQNWMLTMVNLDRCHEGVHAETVDVALENVNTDHSDIVRFIIEMKDTTSMECSKNIGTLDLTADVLVSDGSEFVEPIALGVLYLNEPMYFSLSFHSWLVPAYSSVSNMTVIQNGVVKCSNDCLTSLSYSCTSCDGDDRSPGPVLNFSMILSKHVLSATGGSTTATQIEFTVTHEYSRRHLAENQLKVQRGSVTIQLRDYDCHEPHGLLSAIENMNCAEKGSSRQMMCRQNGWEELTGCMPHAKDDVVSFNTYLVSMAIEFGALCIILPLITFGAVYYYFSNQKDVKFLRVNSEEVL